MSVRVYYTKNGDYLVNLLPKRCQHAIERDSEHATASCALVFDKIGDCKLLLANMDIHQSITSKMVSSFPANAKTDLLLLLSFCARNVWNERWWRRRWQPPKVIIIIIETFHPIFPWQILQNEALISRAPLVVFDGNLSIDAMGTILDICRKYDKPGEFGCQHLFILIFVFVCRWFGIEMKERTIVNFSRIVRIIRQKNRTFDWLTQSTTIDKTHSILHFYFYDFLHILQLPCKLNFVLRGLRQIWSVYILRLMFPISTKYFFWIEMKCIDLICSIITLRSTIYNCLVLVHHSPPFGAAMYWMFEKTIAKFRKWETHSRSGWMDSLGFLTTKYKKCRQKPRQLAANDREKYHFCHLHRECYWFTFA